jgi:hypothetical protein
MSSFSSLFSSSLFSSSLFSSSLFSSSLFSSSVYPSRRIFRRNGVIVGSVLGVVLASTLASSAGANTAPTLPPLTGSEVTTPTLAPEPVVGNPNAPEVVAESKSSSTPARLSEIKSKGVKEIAKRQSTLAGLAAKLAAQKKDCGTNTAMAAEVTTTMNSLTTVGQQLAVTSDMAAAKKLYQSIFIDHRVYILVQPKSGNVIRCDAQLGRNDALAAEAATLQTAIDLVRGAGGNVAPAQSAKDAAVAALSTINPATALGGITGLTPDRGDKARQAANTAALKAADTALDASSKAQKNVNSQLDAARRLLREPEKALRDAQRDAEKDKKKAAKEAEKNAKEAARQAEKAKREAEKETENDAKKSAKKGTDRQNGKQNGKQGDAKDDGEND